jgi:DNA-directed RNA polymerase specialized sigma24 family protein
MRRLRARVAAESRLTRLTSRHVSFDTGFADRAAELGFEVLLERLPDALDRLDTLQRELLLREHRLGESNREIANWLGLSEGQASRLRQKAHAAFGATLLKIVNEPTFLYDNPAAAEVWQGALRDFPANILGSLIRQRTGW